MFDSTLDLLSAFFNSIWNGLSQTSIPGTEWTVTGFFLAIFAGGVLGLVLKWLFKVFNTHFGRGYKDRTGAGRAGWEDLRDD